LSKTAVAFDNVVKNYPLYHQITGGIKNFLLNIPKAIKNFKVMRYQALAGVSFEVQQGETFGIIGNNGAGKSTILSLIAGVILPNSGKVTVNGRVLPLLELGSGFHHELSGRDNIVLNGVLMGYSRTLITEKMEEIIAFSEIGEFIDQPIRAYSSGMLARLGFSVVAHLDPEILLIDEILAVGDLAFQKKCLNKIMGFKGKGVTIIFVSHNMDDVKMICDRVAWIDGHKVKMIGKPGEVINAYTSN